MPERQAALLRQGAARLEALAAAMRGRPSAADRAAAARLVDALLAAATLLPSQPDAQLLLRQAGGPLLSPTRTAAEVSAHARLEARRLLAALPVLPPTLTAVALGKGGRSPQQPRAGWFGLAAGCPGHPELTRLDPRRSPFQTAIARAYQLARQDCPLAQGPVLADDWIGRERHKHWHSWTARDPLPKRFKLEVSRSLAQILTEVQIWRGVEGYVLTGRRDLDAVRELTRIHGH